MDTCTTLSRALSRIWFLTTLAVVVVGCDWRGTEFLTQQLSDGQALGELLEQAPSGVVILVSPGQCLTCDRRLKKVLATYPSQAPPIPVVFTRPPSKFELRRFTLEGVPRDLTFMTTALVNEVTKPIVLARRDRQPLRVLRLAQADAILNEVFPVAPAAAQSLQ